MFTIRREDIVLLAGIFTLVLCMGIGRYAFTPMIPVLMEQTGITLSTAGWMASWGYIGYLVGLFIVWLVSDLRAKDFFFRYGLVVSVLGTLVMAAHDNILVWAVGRFFTGVASAAGFMIGVGLIVNWMMHRESKMRNELLFSGMGLGIMVSAGVVNYLNGIDELNWRLYWVALAGVSACLLLPAMALIPMPKPEEVEMSNLGTLEPDRTTPHKSWIWLMQGAYFCAGLSNTMNITFSAVIAEENAFVGSGTFIWVIVGLGATIAPFCWERVAKRVSYFDALVLAYGVNIVANVLFLFSGSLIGLTLAALLFGFSFMGIVSLTLNTVSRRFRSKCTQVMAGATLSYCLAQVISPAMAGTLAEMTGSFLLPTAIVILFMLVGGALLMLARSQDSTRAGKKLFSPLEP